LRWHAGAARPRFPFALRTAGARSSIGYGRAVIFKFRVDASASVSDAQPAFKGCWFAMQAMDNRKACHTPIEPVRVELGSSLPRTRIET